MGSAAFPQGFYCVLRKDPHIETHSPATRWSYASHRRAGIPLRSMLPEFGARDPTETSRLDVARHHCGAAIHSVLSCKRGRSLGRTRRTVKIWAESVLQE